MQFNVHATLLNGATVFQGFMNYIPRKGEEVDINGHVLSVENVRYILKDYPQAHTQVLLRLKFV